MFKAFILALFLAACDSGNVVHVTGAVSRPGNVALRKATTIEDAIAQAGGLTDEGDRSRLQVFRVVPPALLVRIPPEQIDALQAGDTVHIPHRSYPVQIDSVKEVRNVDFVHEARRYKLGEGQLVHGYTKGDVQVAILLGHGLVEAQTGGGSTAGFHYLYARMHPDQFERLTPFVTRHATQPSTRADALEDAAIIQKKLFFRTDHTDGEKAILPPPGHFEIFAGAYPLPRSAAHPGPGMRRRVYDDGRVWTTFGDGRQRTRFPDGMLVRLNAEGTRRTEFPDNRVEIKYPWWRCPDRTPRWDHRIEESVRHPCSRLPEWPEENHTRQWNQHNDRNERGSTGPIRKRGIAHRTCERRYRDDISRRANRDAALKWMDRDQNARWQGGPGRSDTIYPETVRFDVLPSGERWKNVARSGQPRDDRSPRRYASDS